MLRPGKSPVLDFKILFLALLMLGVLAAISIRLWFMQIRMNVYYCNRIQGRSEVTVRIPAIRGEIRDRDGVLLATNRSSYCVEFFLLELVSGYTKNMASHRRSKFKQRIPIKCFASAKRLTSFRSWTRRLFRA